MTDLSRVTILTNKFEEIYLCLNQLKEYVNVLSVDDHFLYPYTEMYRDINIIFEDPLNKHIGEIQINTKAMISFKNELGHNLFDIIRKLNAKAFLEKRSLSRDEQETIRNVTKMSQNGYNKAFAESHKNTRIGVYGICIKNNKVLMVTTKSGSRTIYNFPGGGVEDNEGFSETLKREFLEEVGTEIIINKQFHTSSRNFKHPDFENDSFHLYYLTTIESEINPNLEGATWFDIDSLPLEMILDIDLEVVQLIKNTVSLSSQK